MMSDWEKFWQDFFTYSGRLSRSRYNKHIMKAWKPFFILWVANFLIVDIFELSARFPHLASAIDTTMIFAGIVFLICTIVFTPRRLHDIGKSGWWNILLILLFFSSVPFGTVLLVVFCLWVGNKDGDVGKNKYGDPPPED